ncbi:hypothetical protein X777_12392 [Ooceraea biroi]|uniref:Uncharacterized protein n=1 Tax=Ooceraea biroi TaxID=2015173 RepID=A0A026VZV5_OOCBI|nr:hypothetical protein X777_12392 [Ooceraea biroi]
MKDENNGAIMFKKKCRNLNVHDVIDGSTDTLPWGHYQIPL